MIWLLIPHRTSVLLSHVGSPVSQCSGGVERGPKEAYKALVEGGAVQNGGSMDNTMVGHYNTQRRTCAYPLKPHVSICCSLMCVSVAASCVSLLLPDYSIVKNVGAGR